MLEDVWREILPYLDEMLELEAGARQKWLAELQARAPDLAERLHACALDLEELEKESFLEDDLSPILPLSLATGQRLGHYTLDRVIGQGGMGTVWLAHRSDGRFEGQVAIKVLNASLLGAEGGERFRREGHLLAKLEHLNIARLLDAGVSTTGQPLLVLEYVPGSPINEYCDNRRLHLRERIELFLSALAAVSHAHSRLVIHRDLKPANIFVTANGTVKLLDFGIAKLTDSEGELYRDITTHGGATPLTLKYASPEQIRGADIGTASDVYSLGVLLYELVTGTLPYSPKRATLGALEEEILLAEPAAPSRADFGDRHAYLCNTTARKLRKLLQGDLDAILLTALKKAQSERYSTAAMFAEDLKRYLRSEPILTRGVSSWYRLRKFVRRNKLPAIAAMTSVTALTAGLGMALWQARLAREQAARAQEINQFIESVFQDAHPYGGGTADGRAIDLLLRGRERVERELRNRRPLQLELMCTIGSSLFGLGANPQARNTFERVTALSGGMTGLSKVPIGCLNDYADLMTTFGDYDAADRILRVLEEGARYRPPDLMTGKILGTRASLELNRDHFDKALSDALRANEIIHPLVQPGSRESLEAALDLARVQFVSDDNAAALATAEQALREYAANPAESARTKGISLLLRGVRARALSQAGRSDEAAQEYASLLPELGVVFGTHTHQYSVELYEYHAIELRRGELRHALSLARDAIEAAEAGGGGSRRTMAHIALSMSLTYIAARNVPEAIAWASRARAAQEEAFGVDAPRNVRYVALTTFTRGLHEHPLLAAAQLEPLIQRVRSEDRAVLPRLLWFEGDLLLHARQYPQAVAVLQEAEAQAAAGGDINRTFQLPVIRSDLGLALLAVGKLNEAADNLQAALSGQGVPHTPTPAQANANAGLARLFLKRNDARAALEQATIADDFWREFDPQNGAHREARRILMLARRAAAKSR